MASRCEAKITRNHECGMNGKTVEKTVFITSLFNLVSPEFPNKTDPNECPIEQVLVMPREILNNSIELSDVRRDI